MHCSPPLRIRNRVWFRFSHSQWPVHVLVIALASCLTAALTRAQAAPAPADSQAQSLPGPAMQPGPATQPGLAAPPGSPAPNPDDAWLQKTSSLYYSTAKAGLGGFDCAVHPDWRTLFFTVDRGSASGSAQESAVAPDDARILLLQTVKINLHAHMQGGSTLDWNQDQNPGKPLDDDSSALLTRMRQTTEETLEGFLQFWTPFMDGSVVPESADGLAITHTGALHTIHAQQGGTALTETFSSDLLLQHFDVDMNGISIKFQPAYEPTGQGLLVKSFQAHVQPAGVPPDQAQEMHVDIEYQTLEGFPIPSRLSMIVANSGNFNFVLDGCTVSRLQAPEPPNQVKPALQ